MTNVIVLYIMKNNYRTLSLSFSFNAFRTPQYRYVSFNEEKFKYTEEVDFFLSYFKFYYQ